MSLPEKITQNSEPKVQGSLSVPHFQPTKTYQKKEFAPDLGEKAREIKKKRRHFGQKVIATMLVATTVTTAASAIKRDRKDHYIAGTTHGINVENTIDNLAEQNSTMTFDEDTNEITIHQRTETSTENKTAETEATTAEQTSGEQTTTGMTTEAIFTTIPITTTEEIPTEKSTNYNSEYSKELITPDEAYENLKNFIASGEYANIKGNCVAENIADICLKNKIPLAQTIGLLANVRQESKFCPLIKEVEGGSGYGLFQFSGALNNGKKGETYGDGVCQVDGFFPYIENNYPDCSEFIEKYNDDFNAYDYGIDDQKMAEIVSGMDEKDKNTYLKLIAVEMEYVVYTMSSESPWLHGMTKSFWNTTDSENAARLFCTQWEIPKKKELKAEQRASNARIIIEKFQENSNNPDLSGLN